MRKEINLEEILAEIRVKNTNQEEFVRIEKAEEFIDQFRENKNLCLPKKQEKFINYLESLIYSPLIVIEKEKKSPYLSKILNTIDFEIMDECYAYLDALEIMKAYDQTNSWEEVKNTLIKQEHTKYSMESILEILLEYANIGVDFANLFASSLLEENRELKRMMQERVREEMENTNTKERKGGKHEREIRGIKK